MAEDLAGYYDRLTRWNDAARVVGYGGGIDTLTVHRPLADPKKNGQATPTRLHDILLGVLPTRPDMRVLDAGCGLGGTMIDFARRLGGHYIGLTLSEQQATIAAKAAAREGMSDRVSARVQSYDRPPAGPFDLVLAIESLAHSPDPSISVAALASVLTPTGVIAIVDDMPEPEAEASADLAAFKSGWRCPVVWRRSDYVRAFESLGLRVIVERDLTPEQRPRTLSRIRQLLALNRIASLMVPLSGVRDVLASHRGGLALERLSLQGLMRYRLLVAGAPSSRLD